MIKVENVKKNFRLYKKPSDRLKEIIFKKKYHRSYNALQNVSFKLQDGESIGILGENGAGKSTLLKIIMGILLPDSGEVITDGRITGLLELGTGFNPEYSGRENIYFNGAFLNLSKEEINKQVDNIIEFAELGEFIHEPLKTYSSGMSMRLAFSIAIHANPKCLLVDEALSVGDVYFQQKCFDWLKNFKKSGKSFIFVSHDMNAIKMFCDKSIVLNDGVIAFEGDPDSAVEYYSMLMAKKNQVDSKEAQLETWDGNKSIFIEKVKVVNSNGYEIDTFNSGEKITLQLHTVSSEFIANYSAGIMIRNKFGQEVYGINTAMMNKHLSAKPGDRTVISFSIPKLNLGASFYSLTTALHDGTHHLGTCYHWVERAGEFEVVIEGGKPFTGMVKLDPEICVEYFSI